MERGRVQMLHVEFIHDGGRSEFIGLAYAHTAFHTATRHPHRKAPRIVIAARAFHVFRGRLTAEFAAPDDKRAVEKAALFNLKPKSGDGMSRKGAKKKQMPTSRHSPTG